MTTTNPSTNLRVKITEAIYAFPRIDKRTLSDEQERIEQLIDTLLSRKEEEVLEFIREIDWSHSQTGIAIGTKKSVANEIVGLLEAATHPKQ